MLTPKEIAALTGLSYRSVLREIEEGKLKSFRLRGRLRVDNADYFQWMNDHVVIPASGSDRDAAQRVIAQAKQLRKQRPAGSLRALHESTLP